MRILLVEDDPAVAGSIELMVRQERWTLFTTELGEEGLDLGKLYDYDIILLDLTCRTCPAMMSCGACALPR